MDEESDADEVMGTPPSDGALRAKLDRLRQAVDESSPTELPQANPVENEAEEDPSQEGRPIEADDANTL